MEQNLQFSTKNERILITTPIFYPNAEPHIGSVHTMVLADFYNRCFKKFGYDSLLLTGLDEHGNKVYNAGLKYLESNSNKSIMDFLNEISDKFKQICNIFHINYDKFIRTTDEDHKNRVKQLWKTLESKNLIYEGIYKGYYSLRDETYYQENELIDGKSPSGDNVKYEESKCYFLKSSIFLDQIKSFYHNKIDATLPNNRQNAITQYISKELNDICISRQNCNWGIDIPDHENDGKIYVWFDALINYLCLWENRKVIHFVGKDILIFHGLHWLIILMALNYNPFDHIIVHNWWMVDNDKMSKSLGNVINPNILVDNFGYECVRFYMIKENLINSDGQFNIELMIEYFNAFLVNKFSNLVYRVETILYKNFGNLDKKIEKNEEFQDLNNKLHNMILIGNINEYLNILFKEMDDLNAFVDKNEIWKSPELGLKIYNKIKTILNFMEPIIPTINYYWNEKNPIMLFKSKKDITI